MSDLITVYAARWHALEQLALEVGTAAVAMPADLSSGYTLLPHEARAMYAAWQAVLKAPHVAPQPRLFDEREVA